MSRSIGFWLKPPLIRRHTVDGRCARSCPALGTPVLCPLAAYRRYACREDGGGRTLVDVTSTGVDTWPGDRVRPAWGIFRSLGDTSGYLLLTDLRAYRMCSPSGATQK